MAIQLKSYNEILGNLVRKMIADSPVNDLNRGSVLLTLLEAIASQDFDNSMAILSVLETLNIDAVKNSDLDLRAADYGITRIPASKATGFVKIGDSSITKRATTLYAVKPAPIASATVIYVNDASTWNATGGQLYIGRGTQQFEGPITYTSIVNNGSFYTINLASSLQKDHLISDTVIDAQSKIDRLITAGTVVNIPANNQSQEITYLTLRNAVLAAGEDSVDNVPIVAEKVGTVSNTGIGTIVNFSSSPFPSATVSNTSALTDGRDTESDTDLRERVKNYATTLARGTRESILASIIGVSDSEDGKQVASAVITEPPSIGDPSIVYLDDGTGFQPSYKGQAVDILLNSANGDEEFLQLANYPLPRPQIINQTEGPVELADGMILSVLVDGIQETVTFSNDQFVNITSASFSEIAVAINDQSLSFKCRLTDDSSRLLLYPSGHDSEKIQVVGIKTGEDSSTYANGILKFPTIEYSYISLYRNNEKLNEKETFAFVLSNLFSSWGVTPSNPPDNLIIEVDGTPPQDRSFSSVDFGGKPVNAATLSEWVEVFNSKFAGIQASATSTDRLQISSNRSGVKSKINIVGGTYFNKMFGGAVTESQGQNSSFALNRQTGNIRLNFAPNKGDSISAGAVDTKGSSVSYETTTGSYNLSSDSAQRKAEIVFAVDSEEAKPRTEAAPVTGNLITISVPSTDTMRIMINTLSVFAFAQINDFIYIAYRGAAIDWFSQSNCGLFKIKAKGAHTSIGIDTYVDVVNVGAAAEGPFAVIDIEDMQIFKSTSYPQLWNSDYLSTPASASLQAIVDSIKANVLNVKASIYKTNSIKATSSTENGGSISTPVSIGRGTALFETAQENQFGNISHTASKETDKDLVSLFKRTEPVETTLDRYTYSSIKDELDSSAVPQTSLYNEEIEAAGTFNSSTVDYDDYVAFGSDANKGHFRTIKEFIAGDKLRTQLSLPRTAFDHMAGEKVDIIEPLSVSATDSVVFILDGDAVNKTINVNMWRTGRINSDYIPSSTSFSAYDVDNEPGKTFGDLQIWSKSLTGAEFKDYSLMFRSRNWYRTGGALSAGATLMIRAKEYGIGGDKYRFNMEYPALPDQTAKVAHANTPETTSTTFTFASGPERVTGIVGGTTFKVTSLGSYNFRYTFNGAVDFTQIVPGDVLSISNSAGVSTANSGKFSINASNDTNKTIDIYNPSGSITSVGLPEETDVTCIADVVGTPTVHTIDCTAEGATASTIGSGEYFILNDNVGGVGFWYDIDNTGMATPTIPGVYRTVKIPTVITGDSANDVASKTALIIDSDAKFIATSLLSQITVTNAFNGSVAAGSAGPNTGFVVTRTVDGTSDASLGGKYFKIYDGSGSVAVWFNTGLSSEPIHGCDRSIQIDISLGDSSTAVATAVATTLNADSEFTASFASSTVSIAEVNNGVRTDASAETSGFTVTVTQDGVDDSVEIINFTSACRVFPLASNDAKSIAEKISESQTLIAVAVGDDTLKFEKATREEVYTYVDNTTAMAYDHNPNPTSGKSSFVSLFDGESYVKIFENTSPQFVLKKSLLLPGVVPTIYTMDSCPNQETTDLGEFFKLVPKTIENIKHHLSHKALSQLSIIADVDVSSNFRKVQIKSKQLGTAGSVEVVGGRGNLGDFLIIGDTQVVTYGGKDYIEVKTSAYPTTINSGEVVKIYNTLPAKRRSRLKTTDTVDVVNVGGNNFQFVLNEKEIYSSPYIKWTISDVSATYGVSAGTIWRWMHDDGGSKVEVESISNSNVPFPVDYTSTSTPNADSLHVYEAINGSGSAKSSFSLTVSDTPDQGDYFFIQMNSPSAVSFAVWYGVDGDTTPPSGSPYSSATYTVMIPILSTDSTGSIVFKTVSELQSNINFSALFNASQSNDTNLNNVVAGDLVCVDGAPWSPKNQVRLTGDGKISGFPIINVDVVNRFVDVMNPNGTAMSTPTYVDTGSIIFTPAYKLEWKTKHEAKTSISTIVVTGNNCAVSTETEHGLEVGSSIVVSEAGNSNLNGTVTVDAVTSPVSFSYTKTVADGSYIGGKLIASGKIETRYRLEKIGFNGMFRLVKVGGQSPYFVDCGVAVDDFMIISGETFKTVNNGKYRVLAVDNDSIIIKSDSLIEERNTYVPFNSRSETVDWTTNSLYVSGSPEALINVTVGSWVKKSEDSDEYFVQVMSIDTSSPTLYVLTLGSEYRGITSESTGVIFNQVTGVDGGVILKSRDDVKFFEGDSVLVGDSLIVENISIAGWFNTANTGVHLISECGTTSDNRPFVRTISGACIPETDRSLAGKLEGFYVLEGEDNLFESYRLVEHTAINQFNYKQRVNYLTPADRFNKMSQSYGTKIESQGKLGFVVGVSTGVDGYTYYTGLMRTVQRIIDGYEPDSTNYPGKRAVGSSIELLPPLIKRIDLTIRIVTREGVNLTDISNDIKSSVIGYVNNLGVGEDVILSEMVARIMSINGIDSATFTNPVASTERITVADDQKPLITPEQISLS